MKNDFQKFYLGICAVLCLSVSIGCGRAIEDPKPGPDQQGAGLLSGAALGAGSGAVTSFQVASSAVPGAWIGAGLGAVYGAVSGFTFDQIEEDQIRKQEEEQHLREVSWAQEVLAEQYKRRMELHPNREIYPADIFFDKDSVKLRCGSAPLVAELAKLTQRRMPWSRILIASYVTSSDRTPSRPGEVAYGTYLNESRAQELAREFIHSGIEARRVVTQAITLKDPVLIDPYDAPARYRQAIEIIPLDY